MSKLISSPTHPLVKHARSLARRKGRVAAGAFLVEGLRAVLTALEQEAPVEHVLCCPDQLTSPVARAAVAAAARRGVPVTDLTPEAFGALSRRDNPVGLAIVARMLPRPLDSLGLRPDGVYVALDDVADPGNLGTVFRTLDAAGAAGLVLTGGGTDPYHPTAVRASMGTLFTVPWAQAGDLDAVLAWARRHGLFLLATSARAAASYWDAAPRSPMLILVGGERQGLPERVRAAADQAVAIPMWGAASSLNVAVATALVVYEARRRGRAGSATAAG